MPWRTCSPTGGCGPSASATSCPGTSTPCWSRPRSSPRGHQVEVHAYFTQPAVQAADAAHGILTQAWSPIGGITSYRGTGTSTFDALYQIDPQQQTCTATSIRTGAG